MAARVDYFVGETFASLRRNLLMTLVAVTTVGVSLLLLGAVFVVGEMVGTLTRDWEALVEVNVFLRDEITPEQSQELEATIRSMPEVKSKGIEYISKDQALVEFRTTLANSPVLIENIDQDTLPASYRVELTDPNTAEAVSNRLSGQPGVEEVRFGGEDIKKLLAIITYLRRGVFIAVALFMGAALLLIANTIRLAIFARRREITTMKLVGATNWFVRLPFLFEGMLEGAMGALIAGAFVMAGKAAVLDGLQQSIPFLPVTVGWDVLLRIVGLLVVLGMFIGAVGSSLALRRFLEA